MKQKAYFKEFARYTSLNVLGMIGLSCYILADTYFISRGLGANGLTALNLAIPVYSLIHGSGLMLGMGGATRYAVFKGQQADRAADNVFTNTLYAAAVLAAAYVFAGIFLTERITRLVGADAAVFDMTNTYLRVILLFAPAFIMNNVLICFVRNDGNPRLSMLSMLIGSLSNIVLDYLFIFPLGMGIFGAVLATGFAPVISMAVLSGHRKKKAHFHLAPSRLQPAVIGSVVSLGIPSLISEVASGAVMLVFNMIILNIRGNVGVAAYGVIANLSLVVVSMCTGIAQGMQPLVSRAYGHGDGKQMRQMLRYAFTVMLFVSFAIYICVFFFADPLAGIFNSEQNQQLQQIAVEGLRIYFLAIPFVGTNIILSMYFTSAERALPAQMISLLRGLIVIIPVTFLLSRLAGLCGVWSAFPVTEGIVSLLSFFLYTRFKRFPLTMRTASGK